MVFKRHFALFLQSGSRLQIEDEASLKGVNIPSLWIRQRCGKKKSGTEKANLKWKQRNVLLFRGLEGGTLRLYEYTYSEHSRVWSASLCHTEAYRKLGKWATRKAPDGILKLCILKVATLLWTELCPHQIQMLKP